MGRQPLSPDDVAYASYPSPPNGFVSTVTLGGRRLMENALWREANVLDVPCRGEGQTKKMSEQKAAKVMIDLLQRKRLIATTQLFAQEQDLDLLAQGCRLGEKGRFKRLVREMRAGIVPAVGH